MRETIKSEDLQSLAICNSDKIPHAIEVDGIRREWVGIGWVDAGEPDGTEVLVIK